MKAILLCYEAVSGLKVNFRKRELLGVMVDDDHSLNLYAAIMGCKIGSFPSIYLGLPLCIGRAPKSVWNLVIERVEK